MHFSFKNWAHSVIYLCVCKVWRIINCSWTSEALQNLITKTRSGFWMHAFWVFFFSFFLLPPRGPMEGRWLCRWSGRIWQPVPSRAYCAAQSSFPDPGKGGSGQWGPIVLPGWIQADTRSHASRACQALKHPPLCLPSPVTVLWESCVVWWPCSELMVARYLPIPGFFIIGLSPPDLCSLGILYSAGFPWGLTSAYLAPSLCFCSAFSPAMAALRTSPSQLLCAHWRISFPSSCSEQLARKTRCFFIRSVPRGFLGK